MVALSQCFRVTAHPPIQWGQRIPNKHRLCECCCPLVALKHMFLALSWCEEMHTSTSGTSKPSAHSAAHWLQLPVAVSYSSVTSTTEAPVPWDPPGWVSYIPRTGSALHPKDSSVGPTLLFLNIFGKSNIGCLFGYLGHFKRFCLWVGSACRRCIDV